MNKCKDCGREERGYGSLLNSDGYCFTCSYKHYDELKAERDLLKNKLKYAINFIDCVRRFNGKCRPEECEVTLRVLKEKK